MYLDKGRIQSSNVRVRSDILLRMNDLSTSRRQLGFLFAAGGVLLAAVLFSHPQEHVQTFADVIDSEIRNRVANQLVHGSAIVVLGLLLAAHICFVRLTRSTGIAAAIAVTAFGIGCALMTASLIQDGFVTPALALKYRSANDPTVQQTIEALIRFCGINIGTLMPMALLSFATSAIAWGAHLTHIKGPSHVAGVLSALLGLLIGVGLWAATPKTTGYVLMGGLSLVALWQLAFAVILFKAGEEPSPSEAGRQFTS